jgi:hypothetical protein
MIPIVTDRIVQIAYVTTGAAVGYVEFMTSSGFIDTCFYTVVGGVLWPITVGVWIGRGWLLPFLHVHGVL